MPLAVPAEPGLRIVDWARLRTGLVWAYEGPPQQPHRQDDEMRAAIAWLLLEGSVEIEGPRSGIRTAHAGQWLFPAADKLRHDFSVDARILSIRFLAHWPNGQPLFSNQNVITLDADRFPQLLQAATALMRIARRIDRSTDWKLDLVLREATLEQHTQLERATLRWLAAYADAMVRTGVRQTPMTRSDPRVAQAQTVLNSHPPDLPLDEAGLSQQIGLSMSQLNRLFVAQVGQTPRAYFQERRLDLAKQALLSRRIPVKQVAFLLGFKQPSHFCRWFESRMHVTPGRFKRGLVPISQALE